MSSYQKELEKYRDIDEDEILRTLSPEELEQLDCELQEMDPEVGAPAGGPGAAPSGIWEGCGAQGCLQVLESQEGQGKCIWRCFREPRRGPRSKGRSDVLPKTHP